MIKKTELLNAQGANLANYAKIFVAFALLARRYEDREVFNFFLRVLRFFAVHIHGPYVFASRAAGIVNHLTTSIISCISPSIPI